MVSVKEKVESNIFYKIFLLIFVVSIVPLFVLGSITYYSAELEKEALVQNLEGLQIRVENVIEHATENQLKHSEKLKGEIGDSLSDLQDSRSKEDSVLDSLSESGAIREEVRDELEILQSRDEGAIQVVNYTVEQRTTDLQENWDVAANDIKIDIQEHIILNEKTANTIRLKFSYLIIVLFMVTAFGVFITSYVYTKGILGPVQRLTEGVKEVASGNLDYSIEVESKDEIGTLAQEFNVMVGERRLAEKALVESEERYRGLVENTTDAIIGLDIGANIVYWNMGAEEMLGYTLEEVLGESNILMVPEESRESCSRNFKDATIAGFVKEVESTRITKDKEIIPVEMSLSTLKDDEGEHIGFVSVLRDISIRKEAEEILMRSREELANLVDEKTMEVEEQKEELAAANEELTATNEELIASQEELQNLNVDLEGKVDERTVEMKERVAELERWYKLTVGREIRMKEMKGEMRDLKEEIERLKIGKK